VASARNMRRQQISEALEDRAFVSVPELSAEFGISDVTIRSDLAHLEREGVLRRVHGGAVRAALRVERRFEETQAANAEEKQLIGRAAAELVSSGDAIFLDVGTTTTAVARELLVRGDALHDVVVFTNAVNIALLLEPAIPRFTVVLTGGTLRPLQHSLVDPLAGVLFERIRIGTAFIGCNGVDPDAGVTNLNLPEAEVKRRMLQASRRRIVVADGSKFGEVAVARLCPIEDVDLFVTGASADAEVLRRLAEQGAELSVAGRHE
jgi:DeoR family transcriptional regulator, aga operon transcriptional repressor